MAIEVVSASPYLPGQCVESQEWTYGVDNTGTRFNDTATYEVLMSNGSSFTFEQTPTGNWSQQLQQWATAMQAQVDAKGLLWDVEPRFVDNPNPPNIDGTINGPGGTPSGLPGAPSSDLAERLIAGGMAWRYVNIQICAGQPVPTRMRRIASVIYGDDPYDLLTVGALLGPLRKFIGCFLCGEPPKFYEMDGVTEVEGGAVPRWFDPCGTYLLMPSPPGPVCQFVTTVGCDNGGADPNAQITRTAKFCDGDQISVEYFSEDPTDPAALVEYTLVGDFVDCDDPTVVLDDPEPEPSECCPVVECGCDPVTGAEVMFGVDPRTGAVVWNVPHPFPCAKPFTACYGIAGFDYYTLNDFDLNDPIRWDVVVDGTVQGTSVDVPRFAATVAGTPKSAWYANLQALVNSLPGWSMTIVGDVANDTEERVRWRFDYNGTQSQTLELRRLTGTNDFVTITAVGQDDMVINQREGTFPVGSDHTFPC